MAVKYIILRAYSREDATAAEALWIREKRLPVKQQIAESAAHDSRSGFAEMLLRFISDYNGSAYRPERCDVYEPVQESFDRADLTRPIRWLSQPGGRVLLRKSKHFGYQGYIENRRFPNLWDDPESAPRDILRDPVFLTEWWLLFRTNVLKHESLDQFRRFFWDLCAASKAEYGFFTMKDDHDEKNFLVQRTETMMRTRYVGNNLEVCLPGVYYANYFGQLYVEFFGRQAFETAPAAVTVQLPMGAWYLQVSDDLNYYLTPKGKQAAQRMVDHLGREAFFDIRDPMRRCLVPEYVKQHRRSDYPLSE